MREYRVLPRGVSSEYGVSTGCIIHGGITYTAGQTVSLAPNVAEVHARNIEPVRFAAPETEVVTPPTPPPAPTPAETSEPTTEADPKAERLAELEAMDWRQIKDLAEGIGITEKPEGGWDAAIPEILAAEFES